MSRHFGYRVYSFLQVILYRSYSPHFLTAETETKRESFARGYTAASGRGQVTV